MRVDTRLSRLLAFLLPASSVAALGILANLGFLTRRFEGLGALVLANLLTGVCAGLFALANGLVRYEDLQIRRDCAISDVSYRIRNAVTVLALHGTREDDPEGQAAVRLAVQRIECALETVAPEGRRQKPGTHRGQKIVLARSQKNGGSGTARVG
jgi:hypothetical protein